LYAVKRLLRQSLDDFVYEKYNVLGLHAVHFNFN
jgi:hypothetical protein